MIWAQKLKMSRDPEHVNFRGVLSCVCWDLTGPLLTCRRVTRYAYNATFFFEILKGRCYGNRFWRELAKIGNFGPVTLEFCRRICIGRAYTLDFYHAFLVFKFNYFTASRMRYIVISLFVCLSVRCQIPRSEFHQIFWPWLGSPLTTLYILPVLWMMSCFI